VDEDLPEIEPLKNLYVETSRQLTCFTGIFRRIVETIGAERVIFGSGAPFKEVLPSIIKMMDTEFTSEVFQQIAYKNSEKLLERKNKS
jgi:predicted TIM-barrel fold metal-dependent hydrolase